ncbi:hypothetical protein, conserved [Eimeria tenella]|uniref:Uncharacterized protein n=1 Tax=Eimeria tenella TaxID=5802 RepID=U6KJK2_EIMTE|nr:hypothetical protein, conserved [Eimeria tenella]CDJ38109.1 hypothetical protein, conserved [Eimeria tenella]|eukprot:XP_013228947.1 hypothetical protein, conserved [Eimeria tenella]
MTAASAVDLRRLVACMWILGQDCELPRGDENSRRDFILLTLLKLQYLIEPPLFTSENGEDEAVHHGACSSVASDSGGRVAAAAVREAKSPAKKLKLLQQVTTFMLQRVGIALDLRVLFRAEADAVAELLRLAESLAAAVQLSLNKKRETSSHKVKERGSSFSHTEPGREEARERSRANISEDCKATIHTVKYSVEEVLSSIDRFYGKAQAGEIKRAGEFLQALLAQKDVSADSPALSNRGLLEEQLRRSRSALANVEKNNDTLLSQVQELKERIRGEERNAERLSKQLLLLRRSHVSGAASEAQQELEMQEQLRELYIQYARCSAVCDTLTASVEDIASRAEAAAAQNSRRQQEARQQLLLDQAATITATDAQSNVRQIDSTNNATSLRKTLPFVLPYPTLFACDALSESAQTVTTVAVFPMQRVDHYEQEQQKQWLHFIDTLCGGMTEDMGMTLATSEQLCTEGSELDLAAI